MLLDRVPTKAKRPLGGGGASLEVTDISNQVPKIDDVLAAVDDAIGRATSLNGQLTRAQAEACCLCGCK